MAAIGANIGYAVGDIFGTKSSRKIQPLLTTFWVVVFNVLIFSPLAFVFRDNISHFTVWHIFLTLTLAILLNYSYLNFNRALAIGNAPLVGAITGSFPALVVIFSLIIFKESITFLQGIMISLVIIGIILSSIDFRQKITKVHVSIRYALLTLAGWGLYFTLIKVPIVQIGWFWVHYLTNILGVFFFGAILLSKRQTVFKKPTKVLYLPAITALLTGGATLLFNFALNFGKSSVVAPIAGSYPALFAILAFFIFKEKLTRQQIIGVVITLASVIALSFISV